MTTKQENEVVLDREDRLDSPPPLCQVVLLNDDFTPMDFVIEVLQTYFRKDVWVATEIMLKVHHEGRGICGVYPKDVARTKAEQVLEYARSQEHPLQCVVEEV
ncbi:MAG: ATP-dependent Clp protease adapter ClpS [Burkholderiaceae bacterium]|jgi:ATP-dependent Clp protease adaptor protein ClpS|nr:ATP-dependent Clp protease adapter ClpS [Burkholderiaceae bacterium]